MTRWRKSLQMMALVAAVWVLASCSATPNLGREKAALNETERDWVAAIHDGDRERIFGYWTDDAVIYAAGGLVVEGKEAITRFVNESRDRGTTLRIWREPQRTVVSESGDIGYTIGTYEFRRTARDGSESRTAGKHLCAWRKNEDGEWRCTLEIHSPKEGAPPRIPVHPVEVTGDDGDVLFIPGTTLFPCLVRRPAGFDPGEPCDLIVALHGFGSSAESFAAIATPFLEAGMLFAAPRAPTAFLTGDRLGYDWDRAHDEPDDSPLRKMFGRASVRYVIEVVEELKRRYPVRRVFLLGFSQGGAFASVAGIHYPDLVAGVVSIGMGLEDRWFEEGALESGSKVPVLLAHSPDDERVPHSFAAASAEMLEGLDYDVTLIDYDGGHRVTDAILDEVVTWLRAR